MEYSKKEIIDELNKIQNIEEIYTNKIINYKGITIDTKEKYTEVIAQEILNNGNKYDFNKVKQIKRDKSYRSDTHLGKINQKSNRREEIIAKKMYNNNYKDIGKILDYQIPLKDKKGTKAGKIDLMAYNDLSKKLYLVELKNDFSEETLLRCVLEIITYLKQVDGNRLKADFNLDSDLEIKSAILIFEGTRPYSDFVQDKYVNELIRKFKIDVFIAKSKEVFNIKKQ